MDEILGFMVCLEGGKHFPSAGKLLGGNSVPAGWWEKDFPGKMLP